MPIIEQWCKNKDVQAIDIEALISNAQTSRRVEFYLWLINQPLVVLTITLAFGVGIKYEISTPEDPFSLNSSATWIIPVIIAAITAFISCLSKSYETSQKKGDAMILADIKREITPWLDKLEAKFDKRMEAADKLRQESEARAEKQRQESEARAEKQRQESEARAEKQRVEDNIRIAKIFEALDKRLSESKN